MKSKSIITEFMVTYMVPTEQRVNIESDISF